MMEMDLLDKKESAFFGKNTLCDRDLREAKAYLKKEITRRPKKIICRIEPKAFPKAKGLGIK